MKSYYLFSVVSQEKYNQFWSRLERVRTSRWMAGLRAVFASMCVKINTYSTTRDIHQNFLTSTNSRGIRKYSSMEPISGKFLERVSVQLGKNLNGTHNTQYRNDTPKGPL